MQEKKIGKWLLCMRDVISQFHVTPMKDEKWKHHFAFNRTMITIWFDYTYRIHTVQWVQLLVKWVKTSSTLDFVRCGNVVYRVYRILLHRRYTEMYTCYTSLIIIISQRMSKAGNFTKSDVSQSSAFHIWSRNVKGESFILNQICDYNIINHNLLLFFVPVSLGTDFFCCLFQSSEQWKVYLSCTFVQFIWAIHISWRKRWRDPFN